MDKEAALKQQARLAAIEFAICDLSAMCYKLAGWTDGQVKERHDHWLELARNVNFDDATAAEAGLISGELEDALSDLSKLIRTHLGAFLKRSG